jgi:hypothetical protein
MSRPTAILLLLQTILVIIGFFALEAVLKMCGYPASSGIAWNPLTIFLREHGLWLLLLPLAWVFYAWHAENRECGVVCYHTACLVALGNSGLTVALYLFASIYPFARLVTGAQ